MNKRRRSDGGDEVWWNQDMDITSRMQRARITTPNSEFRRYFVQVQNLIGRTHLWPQAIRNTLLTKPHLTNVDRFKVVIFFLCNGVSPQLIKSLLYSKFTFDQDAQRHIEYLITKYPTSRWTAWNIAMNKSI